LKKIPLEQNYEPGSAPPPPAIYYNGAYRYHSKKAYEKLGKHMETRGLACQCE